MAGFHRSWLFWAGLMVTVALLWGWLAFPRSITQVDWVSGDRALWAGDRSRALCVGWMDFRTSIRRRQSLRFSVRDETLIVSDEEQRLFPPAVRRHEDIFPPNAARRVSVRVSYWLVLLAWLAVWLPGLGWWQRRKRAAFQASVADEPGSAAAVVQRE